jgi:hypothetical protein
MASPPIAAAISLKNISNAVGIIVLAGLLLTRYR